MNFKTEKVFREECGGIETNAFFTPSRKRRSTPCMISIPCTEWRSRSTSWAPTGKSAIFRWHLFSLLSCFDRWITVHIYVAACIYGIAKCRLLANKTPTLASPNRFLWRPVHKCGLTTICSLLDTCVLMSRYCSDSCYSSVLEKRKAYIELTMVILMRMPTMIWDW